MSDPTAHHCPHCENTLDRESVDIGIGEVHGPWGCSECGWSSDPEYDCRAGLIDDGDRVLDQYGVSHSKQRIEEIEAFVDRILGATLPDEPPDDLN